MVWLRADPDTSILLIPRFSPNLPLTEWFLECFVGLASPKYLCGFPSWSTVSILAFPLVLCLFLQHLSLLGGQLMCVMIRQCDKEEMARTTPGREMKGLFPFLCVH